MAQPLVALQVQNPQQGSMQDFTQGLGAAMATDEAQRKAVRESIDMVGSMALGAQGGDINGTADPKKWEDGVAYLERVTKGDLSYLKGRPELAQTLARSSLTAAQQLATAQSERDYELAVKRYQQSVAEAAMTRADRRATLDLQERRFAFDQEQAQAAASGPNVKGEGDLRKEYGGRADVKDFREQTAAYQRVLDSAGQASPAGDLALVFNYMKVLDPGSTVREGEFATAAASGAFGERIKAAVDQITTGTRLTPAMRRDFVQRAGNLYQGASGLQNEVNDYYTDLAGSYSLDPARIVQGVPQIGVMDPDFSLDSFLGVEVPEGVDPAIWEHMTPEERQLWQN